MSTKMVKVVTEKIKEIKGATRPNKKNLTPPPTKENMVTIEMKM